MTKRLHVLFFSTDVTASTYITVYVVCAVHIVCLSWDDRTSMILPTIDCFLFDIGTPMHPPVMQVEVVKSTRNNEIIKLFSSLPLTLHFIRQAIAFFPWTHLTSLHACKSTHVIADMPNVRHIIQQDDGRLLRKSLKSELVWFCFNWNLHTPLQTVSFSIKFLEPDISM